MNAGVLPVAAGRFVVLATALAAVAGCTTQLVSTRVNDLGVPANGQVYYLPRSEFQVVLKRELTACGTEFTDDMEAARMWVAAQLLNVIRSGNPAAAMGELLKQPTVADAKVRQMLQNVSGSGPWFAGFARIESVKHKGATEDRIAAFDKDNALKVQAALAAFTAQLSVNFKLETNAQAAAVVMPDLSRVYSIDYFGMQDVMKGTDYAVETYPNGILKSVNVTIDDQTGAVIQGVLSGATKLAAAAGGFPLPAATAHAAPAGKAIEPFADWKMAEAAKRPLCNADVQLKLMQRAALTARVEENADAALTTEKAIAKLVEAEAKAQEAQDKLDAQLKEIEKADPKRPKLEAALKLAQAELKRASNATHEAKQAQSDTNDGFAKAAAKLDAVKKSLTQTKITTVSPEPGVPNYALLGREEARKAWLDPRAQVSCPPAAAGCYQLPQTVFDSIDAALVGRAAVYPFMQASVAKPSTLENGIWYRQPLKSNLYVCTKDDCIVNNRFAAEPDRVVLAAPVDVPQFGPLAFLPLKNGPFQNNNLTASFAESGALTKLTYKTNAQAAKAAEVFDASADTILKFRSAKQNQAAAKLNADVSELEARKKLVDAQLAFEKAQADLDKFRADQKTGQ